MRALILAAGRGSRMQPLSDLTPKPLLPLAHKSLIVWQIERLRNAGVAEFVVNTGWLGAQIPAALGDGSALGVRIVYSEEPEDAYETGGAIATALPLLTSRDHEPFIVVSGDIYTDYDYALLRAAAARIAADPQATTAHFVLTDNPPHHPRGDMALGPDGRVRRLGHRLFNYGNIGVFHPDLFATQPARQAWKLFPWMYAEVDAGRVSGEHFRGVWHNIGTPEQLASLDAELRTRAFHPAVRATPLGLS
ncbi:N-acetylmuramate alpha-1-phosphate uridylyltransferase MurU [Thiomonas sp. FB-Cd]|uniref:N-acetylmuramate alpha-1-phosphate uridylyltransferase MurU n=1 Tax=Thiomonas sp. FB-Cd TaxID=1158292 RepID=UPI00056EFA2F|nr:nucleotidyltransferase family protein [Thiomonas sp. FB-Cd]